MLKSLRFQRVQTLARPPAGHQRSLGIASHLDSAVVLGVPYTQLRKQFDRAFAGGLAS